MVMGEERNVNIDEHDHRANEHCADQHRIDKRTHVCVLQMAGCYPRAASADDDNWPKTGGA
jgi:hypothetical protein